MSQNMEHYKLLNSELIGKVQKLKLENAEYAREVTSLRAKLMDEHERRLNEKKMCYAENVESICLRLLKDINPGVRIHFPKENSDYDDASDGSRRRTSSEIYEEMYRSNAVTKNRNSLTRSPRRSNTEKTLQPNADTGVSYSRNTLTMSPRESNTSFDSSSDSNSCEEVFPVDDDDDEDEEDYQNSDQIIEQANTNALLLYSIMEDDGTEEMESDKDFDGAQSENNTSVTTMIAPEVETFFIQDVTTQFQNVSLTKHETTSSKVLPKQKSQVNNNSNICSNPLLTITPATTSPTTTTAAHISPLRNLTNSQQNVTLVGNEKNTSSKVVPTKRNQRKPSKTDNDTENNITEIQTMRQNQFILSVEPIELFNLTNSDKTTTPRKQSSSNTALNDSSQINLTQFNNVQSSTPIRQRETLSKTNIAVLTTGMTTTSTTNESSTNSSGRPMRACRPTMLKEPNLHCKMRNQLETKKKRK